MTCGGVDKATIWDLIDYSGYYTDRPLCNYYLSKPVDCSKHGGYDPNDMCMQTCMSAEEMTLDKMCENRYTESLTVAGNGAAADLTAKNTYKITCVQELNNLPKPIGCFKDHFGRDLKSYIDSNISIEECRVKADKMKYNYIGMQYGNECRADTNIGKYEKLDDSECNMPCARNTWQKCGASFRQLIFDLRQIGVDAVDCGSNLPIDCTKKAGYDPSDKCL